MYYQNIDKLLHINCDIFFSGGYNVTWASSGFFFGGQQIDMEASWYD